MQKHLFRSIFLCLSVLFAIPSIGIEAGVFHLLLVGDYENDDIQRKLIAEKDIYSVQKVFQCIAKTLDLELQKTVITGELTSQDIFEAITLLDVASDDLLIFYYTGHGISLISQDQDPWPDLYLPRDGELIPLSSLIATVEQKNAHFSLLIADCCNNEIPDALMPHLLKAKAWPKSCHHIEENYRKLFLQNKGLVVLAAAKKKQLALADTLKGSYCTWSFLAALQDEANSSDYSGWEHLLEATASRVEELSLALKVPRLQQPIFAIYKPTSF